MRRCPSRLLAVPLVAGLLLGVVATGGAGAAPARGEAECPLNALERADGPVEIAFWHSMTRVLEETLVALTDQFNSSQDEVEVSLVNQSSYEDTLQKFRAGLGAGELPDIVQLPETGLQQVIDSQAILPAQACVDADDFDLSEYVPRVTDYYTVEDQLWAMPFNVSQPILYYDRAIFEAAGLDPDDPPETLDEIREYSEQIKANAGYPYGFALKIDAFFFEQLLGKANVPYVNNGNGREERATEVNFDRKAGLDIFKWMRDMVDDGLAVTNPRTGPNQLNNYLALGNREAAMTIDTTAGLGTVSQVLGEGQYAHVELGVAPMPGPEKGGTIVGGGAVFLVKESSPAEQAAAWEYAKFLNEPEQVAAWSAGTGYLPTREDAIELPALQERWSQFPQFRVGYDQLLSGKNTLATSGPVIGDYLGVREVIDDQETALLAGDKSPKDALNDAKREADRVMKSYNDRVG
ncbi:MAG TPA: ABC transporter substrate-binding protein [Acidimicrobiia bacterium]